MSDPRALYLQRNIVLTAKGCTSANPDDDGHVFGCITCGARAVTELPEGFVKTSIVFTAKEWDRYRTGRWMEAHGTASEVIRRDLGLPTVPYGLFAAIARMHQPDNNEE